MIILEGPITGFSGLKSLSIQSTEIFTRVAEQYRNPINHHKVQVVGDTVGRGGERKFGAGGLLAELSGPAQRGREGALLGRGRAGLGLIPAEASEGPIRGSGAGMTLNGCPSLDRAPSSCTPAWTSHCPASGKWGHNLG